MSEQINSLADFFVSIGMEVDKDASKRAANDHKQVEEQLTKTQQTEETKRAKLKDEARKKEREAREKAFKKQGEAEEKALKRMETFTVRAAGMASKTFLGITAAAAGVVFAVDKAAQGFERLHYLSQRTGSSASNLTGFGYAASQLGASRESAEAQMTSFSARLNRNPKGMLALYKRMGIAATDATGKMLDPSVIATNMAEHLQRVASQGPYGYSRAENEANLAGIDAGSDVFQAMIRHGSEFRPLEQKQKEMQAKTGADPDDAAQAGTAFEQSMRRVQALLGNIGTAIETDLFKKLKPLLDEFAGWLEKHGRQLEEIVSKLAGAFIALAKALGGELAKLDWDKLLGDVKSFAGGLETVAGQLGGPGGLIALLGLLSLRFATLLPPWLKVALGTAVAADIATPKDQRVGLQKQDDDDASAAPSTDGIFGAAKRLWSWGKGKLGYRSSGNAAIAMRGHRASVPDDPKLDARAKESWDFWKSKGASDQVAAGLLGMEHGENNFYANGGMFGGWGDQGQAYGSFMWHKNRRDRIARETGINVIGASHQEQLEAAFHEMTKGGEAGFWDKVNRAQTPAQAATAGVYGFERPLDKAGASSLRSAYADHWFKMFHGGARPSGAKLPNALPALKMLDQNFQMPRGLGVTPNDVRNNNFSHTQTFNITSNGTPDQVLAAARLSASRGQQDALRNMKGALA